MDICSYYASSSPSSRCGGAGAGASSSIALSSAARATWLLLESRTAARALATASSTSAASAFGALADGFRPGGGPSLPGGDRAAAAASPRSSSVPAAPSPVRRGSGGGPRRPSPRRHLPVLRPRPPSAEARSRPSVLVVASRRRLRRLHREGRRRLGVEERRTQLDKVGAASGEELRVPLRETQQRVTSSPVRYAVASGAERSSANRRGAILPTPER